MMAIWPFSIVWPPVVMVQQKLATGIAIAEVALYWLFQSYMILIVDA